MDAAKSVKTSNKLLLAAECLQSGEIDFFDLPQHLVER
jgi:hypothetical protein